MSKEKAAAENMSIDDFRLAGELLGHISNKVGSGRVSLLCYDFFSFHWNLKFKGIPVGFEYGVTQKGLTDISVEELAEEIVFYWKEALKTATVSKI